MNTHSNLNIFVTCVEKIQDSSKSEKNKEWLMRRPIWRNDQTSLICSANQKTIFVSYCIVFKSCILWENVGENMLEPGRSQMKIWRMRIASWIPRTKRNFSKYEEILTAFPLQEWLHGHTAQCYVTSTSPAFLYIISIYGQNKKRVLLIV